ncbi:MAG: HNH endonuclease [Bacteroidales bacterium]|nr:HNH endonuclease [Bacteroidales bacterium]
MKTLEDAPLIVIDMTSGLHARNKTVHEFYNLVRNDVDWRYYGYCPPQGNIDITRLGAGPEDEYIDGVTVVYARKIQGSVNREVVAFCTNARVYHKPKTDVFLRRTVWFKSEKVDCAYSLESDTLTDLSHYPFKFVIRLSHYGAALLGGQRYFKGQNPEFDAELLAYLASCKEGQDAMEAEAFQRGFTLEGSVPSDAVCEVSASHKTFVTEKGLPYLEAHHLVPGVDAPWNVVLLCPLCRRKLQYGTAQTKAQVLRALYKARQTYLEEAGISLKDLQALY